MDLRRPSRVQSTGHGLSKYIRDKFHMHPACLASVPEDPFSDKCVCGRLLDDHSATAPEEETWSIDKTEKLSTNGFGTLSFQSNAIKSNVNFLVPYIRISSTDDPDAVREIIRRILIKQNDNYEDPSLIISVTGGAQTFNLKPRLLSVIRKGLTKAVVSTEAWVITGGTHTGVMKLVGEIMADVKGGRTIGIAPWGVIKDRDRLCAENARLRASLPYSSTNYKSLDHNHDFFILVDDGTHEKFGGEIAMRAKIEASMSSKKDIPIVSIVVQGGPGTIETVRKAVEAKTPVVVIEGTGKAADLLAYAYRLLHGTSNAERTLSNEELRNNIIETFPKMSAAEIDETLSKILEAVDDEDKITLYSLDEHGDHDIDEAILRAIFRGGSAVSLDNKLRQAMRWDRLDIAKDALMKEVNLNNEELSACLGKNLMWALKNNNPEFVELCLDSGAKVSQLVPTSDFTQSTTGKPDFQSAVEELYWASGENPHSHMQYLLNSRKPALREGERKHSLKRVERILEKVMSDEFAFDESQQVSSGGIFSCCFSRPTVFEDVEETTEEQKENACYQTLMTWAVAKDNYRLAHLFWLRGNESVSSALVASRLLERLSKSKFVSVMHLADERAKMIHNSKKFEQLAVGVLEECQHSDATLVGKMLHTPIPRFKRKNCLEVAYDADNLEFLSHPATQAVINNDWYDDIHHETPSWKIVLTILCPVLIFLPAWAFGITWRPITAKRVREQHDVFVANESRHHIEMDKPKRINKLTSFYNSPLTRFWTDCMAFVVLLVIHSYVTLTDFNDSLSTLEILLVIWFVSLMLEELRQFFSLGFYNWSKDGWNILDFTLVTLYWTGFLVRVSDLEDQEERIAAKTIMCLNTILLFSRLARYYAVSEKIGPKLIMMRQMASDVLVFACLILIFLLAYGIAAQGLLFPDREFDRQTATNVIYRPYFQIFGELFLDDIEVETDCLGPWPFSSCGVKTGYLVPILLAGYLLVTNILLVNLLIAMFNDTYVRVQEQSRKHWNFMNMELFLEYKSRPRLPAPLIIFSHAWRITRRLYRLCTGARKDKLAQYQNPSLVRQLQLFQDTNTDIFVHKDNIKRAMRDSSVIKQNSENIHHVMTLVHNLIEQNAMMRNMIEKQAQSINELLPRNHAKGDSSLVSKDWQPPLLYPDSKVPGGVRRCVVPLAQKPWNVEFNYQPTEFTTEEVLSEPVWADKKDPRSCKFNQVDGRINRISFLGTYHIDPTTGRPLNPRGRTGMTGRGSLGKWGVNHAADPIVTRWKRNPQGGIFERDGRRVLEFVAIQRRTGDHEWAIPGGFVDDGETVSVTLKKEFREEALNSIDTSGTDQNVDHLLDTLFANGDEIATSYSNDPRNTDNAWIETTATLFHDEDGLGVGRFKLEAGDDAQNARWRMVHRHMKLFASHTAFLKAVAQRLRAYW
eukprot:m.69394 g.69394  ORF g.69394 m.69394 type:complete len:1427 (-) comp19982_c0_seq1:42-4322(-)